MEERQYMEVEALDGRRYRYKSDYPRGWGFAKGDSFKKVLLDGIDRDEKLTSFAKRFEVKTPASISGWDLMLQLKRRNVANLSRLYDVVNTKEQGRSIYYVFYEFIEGDTLHNLISRNVPIDLGKLFEALITATTTLQEKKHWFPDFTEKNIFNSKRGGFVLIDLDSTQPTSVVPDKEVWGEKEYWALVFDFYKKFLGKEDLVPANFHGTTLIYLCIIFLILRIKIFQTIKGRDYRDLYDELVPFLNGVSPLFANVFDKVFQDNENPPSPDDIKEIKLLVRDNILTLTEDNVSKILEGGTISNEPVIIEFFVENYLESTSDRVVVQSGETFLLRWEVENASHLELYKDGNLFQTLTNETSIELREEVWDHPEKEIEYTLVARNESFEKASGSLTVAVVNIRVPAPVIISFTATDFFKKNADNDYSVSLGKPFVLNWEVSNASFVELYKNGTLIKKYNDERSDELTEEEPDKEIEYTLVAVNDSFEKSSSSLTLFVINNRIPQPTIARFSVTNFFKRTGVDSYLVELGKTFVLSWEVEHTGVVELYKNGGLYHTYKEEKSIDLVEEVKDENEMSIEYTLVARNDFLEKTPATIMITVIDNRPVPPEIKKFTVSDYLKKNAKNHYLVKKENSFVLEWEVVHASVIELNKNGHPYKVLDHGKGSIKLKQDSSDANGKRIVYQLKIANERASVESNPVSIEFVYQPPVINEFGASKKTVKSGSPFQLTWSIENAPVLKLMRNGKPFKTLNVADTSVELVEENKDDMDVQLTYTLVASNDTEKVKSEPVTVTIREHNKFVYQPPVIHQFSASATTVKSGSPFQLTWNVGNAPVVKLLRNGKSFKTLDATEGSIELIEEKQDDLESQVIYTLVAANDTEKVKSEPVIINLRERTKIKPLPIILAVVALLIIGAIYFYSGKGSAISVKPFTQNVVTESEIITIVGENFPQTPGSMQVEFEKVPGTILQQTKDSIRVQVPALSPNQLIGINIHAGTSYINVAGNVRYNPAEEATKKVMLPTVLPPTLHEIWRSVSGNQFMYVDLVRGTIYYAAGNKNNYDTASTRSVVYDSAKGIFKIPIITAGGEKLLVVRNSTAGSFELCICANDPQVSCNNFTRMTLFYDRNPSVIFLPATVGEAVSDLEAFQSKRFFNFVNNAAGKNWVINVYHKNPFLEPSNLSGIKGLLNEKGIKFSISQENVSSPEANPFERNYITVAERKVDSAKVGSGEVAEQGTKIDSDKGTTTGKVPTAEEEAKNGLDFGNLRFNLRNQPDDASKEILGVIANQLRDDAASKITFYATWYYSKKEDEKLVLTNIYSLKNYLNDLRIRLDSKQVDTKISGSSVKAEYNKSIHVVGYNFPRNFNLEQKRAEYRVMLQRSNVLNSRIKTIRDNLEIGFHFINSMAYCTLTNNTPFETENVEVELSYLPKDQNEIVKKILNFENVKARDKLTLEAPFLIGAHQIEFSYKSIVPKDSN